MDQVGTQLLIAVTAFLASIVASTAGFGGGIILLPLVIWTFGVRSAVPILAVAQLIAAVSRASFNWREISPGLVGRFSLTAVPTAVLGAVLFASAPTELLRRALGLFLLLIVVQRRIPRDRQPDIHMRNPYLTGAMIGVLSGLLGVIGPLLAPLFLSFGLKKGAYVGSVALASSAMQLVKVITYERYDLLDVSSITVGVAIGIVMIAGAYAGKRVLDRLPDRAFLILVEAVLLVSGLELLIAP